jgi:hypothetical protein
MGHQIFVITIGFEGGGHNNGIDTEERGDLHFQ